MVLCLGVIYVLQLVKSEPQYFHHVMNKSERNRFGYMQYIYIYSTFVKCEPLHFPHVMIHERCKEALFIEESMQIRF